MPAQDQVEVPDFLKGIVDVDPNPVVDVASSQYVAPTYNYDAGYNQNTYD